MDKYKVYLNNIVQNVPGSVYWKDKNGLYLGCNNFQAKIVGLEFPEDIVGKTDYDLSCRASAEILRATDQRIMESRTPEELIEQITLIDGTKMTVFTNKAPLYDEKGEIIGIIGSSLDITALHKAQSGEKVALEAAETAETERRIEEETKRIVMIYAGSIAHDLRIPLVCLNSVGFVLERILPILSKCYQVVQKKKIDIGYILNQKDIQYIENALELPKTIEKFINEMQSFITDNLKALKQSTSVNLQEEDLIACISYKGISNALDSYPFTDQQRKLIHWDRRYYFTFLGNPVRFLKIIFNLLNNALYQINKNGKGEIFISSEEQEKYNIIRFKDTAGGANATIINRIFEGYKTTKAEGTGVGLAFCKLIMQSFGGDIICHSIEGNYIEFVLSFPKMVTKDPITPDLSSQTKK